MLMYPNFLFKPFDFLAPKTLNYLALKYLRFLSVPDEDYSTNAWCAVTFISTYSFLTLECFCYFV